MEENEFKNFRNFVELRLRDCFGQFERGFIKWNTDSFADIIAREIHREYHIKQKWDKQKYLLVPWSEQHPLCHGCENEHGTCGTPCTVCPTADKIQNEWDMTLWITNKYRIFERK